MRFIAAPFSSFLITRTALAFNTATMAPILQEIMIAFTIIGYWWGQWVNIEHQMVLENLYSFCSWNLYVYALGGQNLYAVYLRMGWFIYRGFDLLQKIECDPIQRHIAR